MTERLFGVETEYALSATDARGVRVKRGHALAGLMACARRQLPHLPDEAAQGMFLANGGRFYVDCGGHPELTTPECSNPWDVVRFIRAGESVLLRLADDDGRRRSRRMTFFRGNVDYSGSRATWGSHESYMHRMDPAVLPAQIIPHLVSRLVYTGAGGFKNVSAGVEYTLSPRTAHISKDVSSDSTTNRGIFHDKREDLCGKGYRRLHILCGESLCSELAMWLRVGCTALVVAMCEAGLRPGEAVALRNPVEAMRLFAGDPTCRTAAETTTGERLTAIAVQRHYLAQAEAHAAGAFMPPWAGEVCRQWRAVLDRLDGGWEAATTTLDWAIKLGLYNDRVRRRGFAWESFGPWTSVVQNLSTACVRATRGERTLTAELALGRASPIAAEVKHMTAIIEEMGLSWRELGPFLEIRNELFEIDTRFGQLGEQGIFASLDAAGVLTHRVPGVDDVAHAVDHPPDVARARLRGTLVRELARNGDRYYCGWQGVWDRKEGTYIDLSDPFVVTPEWKSCPVGHLPVMDERLIMFRERRRRAPADDSDLESATSTPDPIALNRAALAYRRVDRLDDAERLLRRATEIEDTQVAADSPKRPHRRNNLAVVLMRAGKLVEASRLNADAWRLKAGQHDLTSGRILFVRIALHLLLDDRGVSLYIGQLKTLLQRDSLVCHGDIARNWEIPDVLTMLCERLDGADAELLVDAADALNDRERLASLDTRNAWNAVPAMPLETPWPEE